MIYEIRSRATRAPLGAFEGETPEEAIAAMLVARGIPSTSSALLSVNLDGLEVVPEIVADLRAWAGGPSASDADALGAGRLLGDAFRLAEQDAERVEALRRSDALWTERPFLHAPVIEAPPEPRREYAPPSYALAPPRGGS